MEWQYKSDGGAKASEEEEEVYFIARKRKVSAWLMNEWMNGESGDIGPGAMLLCTSRLNFAPGQILFAKGNKVRDNDSVVTTVSKSLRCQGAQRALGTIGGGTLGSLLIHAISPQILHIQPGHIPSGLCSFNSLSASLNQMFSHKIQRARWAQPTASHSHTHARLSQPQRRHRQREGGSGLTSWYDIGERRAYWGKSNFESRGRGIGTDIHQLGDKVEKAHLPSDWLWERCELEANKQCKFYDDRRGRIRKCQRTSRSKSMETKNASTNRSDQKIHMNIPG